MTCRTIESSVYLLGGIIFKIFSRNPVHNKLTIGSNRSMQKCLHKRAKNISLCNIIVETFLGEWFMSNSLEWGNSIHAKGFKINLTLYTCILSNNKSLAYPHKYYILLHGKEKKKTN